MVTDELLDDLLPTLSSQSVDQDLGKSFHEIHAFYNPLVMDSLRIQTGQSLGQMPPKVSTRRDHFLPNLPGGFGFTGEGGSPFPSGGVEGWSVEQVCGVVAVSVIVPFILVSNLLVVVSVARYKRLQMPTNYFIVSLAAGDIFVAVITPFFIVIEVLPGQVENPVLCLSPNRILMTACGVSVLTMAAIAYDRHTVLVSPLKYTSLMTPRKITVVVASIWVYSAAIVWVPVALGWYSGVRVEEASDVQPCSFQLLHDKAHVLFLGAIFGPACLMITACYCRIYILARQHARAIAAVENSVHHNLRVRFMIRDAKYAKTLALVMGVFFVLWAPYLASMVTGVVANVHVSPWLWNYLTLLAVLNSGLNPWIYAFKNNDFRTAFRKTLKACCSAYCRLGSCSHIKSSRRPSSLSGVNIFTTTTSTSQCRSSRGSTTVSGRLSDVSCIISVGGENVNKVFDVNRRKSLVSTISATVSASLDKEAIIRSMAESTEKRVSTLLNADSKEFIEDLFSLYIDHSFVHKHSDIDAESGEKDRDFDDQTDSYSVDRSDHTDSQLGDHTYQSDHTDDTWHCDVHSDCTDCCYQCDHSSDTHSCHHSYQGETRSCHSDHTYESDHAYHSDQTEDTFVSNTDHLCRCDRAYNSEHSEDCCHSHCTDHSYHSENRDHGNLINPSYGRHLTVIREGNKDDADSLHCQNDTEQFCCVDMTQDGNHGDQTDRGYHSDQSDQQDHKCLEPPGV
ncbi:hypothetical protein ACOMHN_027813 [Nucella lapillus]